MNARELALLALLHHQQTDVYVQDELQRLFGRHCPPAADRALATDIALGAVRHRRTLGLLLARCLREPIRRLPAPVRAILESAVYQILFLDRVPDYAVVNDAVDLARAHGGRRFPGLVNAVLRKAIGLVDRASSPASVRDPRRLIPNPHGGMVILSEPLLPQRSIARMADAHSFPDLLVQRWADRWGEDRAAEVMAALNRPPRLYGRINTLRASAEDVLGRLPADQTPSVRRLRPNVLDLTDLGREHVASLLDDGLVTIEDPTAMLAAEALEPRPGETILDLCAAPGGKTSCLAELMQGQGTLWAVDRPGERLNLLQRTIDRLGLTFVRVAPNEPPPTDLPAAFDRVLVDVPCSNTGVLNRRAEARWRFSLDGLGALAPLQRQLLEQAALATRPGGLCVYSTCSLEPEENSARVADFLHDHPEMVLQAERETLPGPEGDGGYFARLTRLRD